MFRNIKKVDELGRPIKGSLKVWKKNHPHKLYFDSKVEWEVWLLFRKEKVKFDMQTNVTLVDGTTTEEFKKGFIKTTKQQAITYTPDYYLTDYDVYIEVKGFATPEFRLRWKLFKLKGYRGFIVKSKDEAKTILNILKNESLHTKRLNK